VKRIAFAVFMSAMFFPSNAFANGTPHPVSMLAELCLFLALILFTLIGGGYAILKAKDKPKWYNGWALWIIVGIVTFLFSAISAIGALVALIVGILGIVRGVNMIRWGVAAKPGKERPDYLVAANSTRLISSGTLLIIFVLALWVLYLYGMVASMDPYRARGYAATVNADAKNAYVAMLSYGEANPKKSGPVSCEDMEKAGFQKSTITSCSSDIVISKGNPVSGAIRIRLNMEPNRVTRSIEKPEATMTFDGNLDKASVHKAQ